jgi:hypothetical protein
MGNGPKFSGPAHVIFADIMRDDLTKEHGGYTNIPAEAFPPSAAEAIGTNSPPARKRGAKRA